MNADLVCWGSEGLVTKVRTEPEGAESILFTDESKGVLRVFMTPDQMRALKEQLETALPQAPESAETTPETATVQA